MATSVKKRAPRGGRPDRRRRAARAEGRDARQELLSAAAEVFAERGFHGAAIDAIAERAGYSKGTVYWHFEGKDDLFLALIEERVDGPTREMIDLLRSAPADQDMAPEASRRFAQLLAEQGSWLMLDDEYRLRAMRDPKLRRRYARRRRELRVALAEALTARARTLGIDGLEVEPERAATAIMALTAGLAQQSLVDRAAVPGDLFMEIVLLILKGARSDAGQGIGR